MSDDDENLTPQELFDKLLAAQKAASIPPQDPLVFMVTGNEVRELYLALAESYETKAKEEEAKGPQFASMPNFGARLGPSPASYRMGEVEVPLPSPRIPLPPVAPQYRDAAKAARWLADHVETGRIFRLGLHDLMHLGISTSVSGYSGGLAGL